MKSGYQKFYEEILMQISVFLICVVFYCILILANVKEAIALWMETANEFGDPIPEPKGRRLLYA